MSIAFAGNSIHRPSDTPLGRQLQQWIRRGRVLTAASQLAGYDADGLGYKTYRPDAVVIPADADELVALLTHANELNVPVTIRGAGTSLSGGPVAAQGGVVVHTSALKSIRTICREGFWCEVECGVALNQLDAALIPYGLFYPPDPSSGAVCTLGGNVAMNAGGAHCFRYGVTSNYVLGVEAILLDGSVHRFGGPAGGRGNWREDWKRLMVGSEGTLAAMSRFWLRLLPRPRKAWTFRATFADLVSAEHAVHSLAADSSFPVAIELMDPRCVAMVENSPMAVGLPKDAFLLVTEIEGPPELVDVRVHRVSSLLKQAGALQVEYSDDETQRKALWKARKVAGGLMGQMSPDFLVQDAVIPKRALANVLQLVYDEADAAGLPAVNVFHAGDGNLHPNFLFDSSDPAQLERVETISKRLMQRVVEVGGTLSGEHGIGNDKTAYMPLMFSEQTLRMQLSVAAAFNPQHQMNPLKVFSGRRYTGASSISDGMNAVEDVMRAVGKASGGSLFGDLFDEVDGVVCVSAGADASTIQNRILDSGLRFPLMMDESHTLADHLAATEYSPASSRFGAWCDNITGMNWRLPDGNVVRIGERVAKSTTGYDL
ncbi:MAG: FAD-binding protein, partial [Planctomycetaceae bacterium]|nr:FAD-binding protein [Planctomycetaceae bacterium]